MLHLAIHWVAPPLVHAIYLAFGIMRVLARLVPLDAQLAPVQDFQLLPAPVYAQLAIQLAIIRTLQKMHVLLVLRVAVRVLMAVALILALHVTPIIILQPLLQTHALHAPLLSSFAQLAPPPLHALLANLVTFGMVRRAQDVQKIAKHALLPPLAVSVCPFMF